MASKKQIVTMANCIVGVSIASMPFCYKQCGVVLATILLLLSGIMTRTVCYFLLKSSTITRRRTYELLAYHTFGQAGKLLSEISIIGFLIGTLIAFLVVMGDLGPEILADVFDIQNNSSLRSIIMTALSLFVALPLGLIRTIDNLSFVSTVTMLFYVFLVLKILAEGMAPLWSGSFLNRIDYWRPAGVLQCIPIFSMALSCQTQIFGIYDSLPDPSLQKMNEVVKKAIDVCTVIYICVGFFGYIAFCTQSFGGNILLSFGPSWSTQLMKLGFVLSIALSCPVVILPCRASLHSLIFRRHVHLHHQIHDITSNYIPEGRLKLLTVVIIIFTLCVSLLIPNIELVLGLVGSTTGSVICIIFPSVMFIRVTSKNTTERLLAQTVFFVGVIIMFVTTYATLYAVEQAQSNDPATILLGADNLKSPIVVGKVETNEMIEKVIKIDSPPMSLNNLDPKPSSSDQLIVKSPTAADKPAPSIEKTPNVTFVKIKETPNDIKVKFKSENNHADHNEVINKLQDVKLQEIKVEEVGGGGRELHGVKELTNNNLDKVMPPHPVDTQKQVEGESVKKNTVDHSQDHANLKLADKVKVQEVNRAVVVENVEKIEKQEERKQQESSKKVVKKVSEDMPGGSIDNAVKYQDKTLVKNAKPSSTNLTAQVVDSRKLNAEDVLKQLEKHEKEQKLLLAEQKEILAKLKQHQADDELKHGAVLSGQAKVEKQQVPQEISNVVSQNEKVDNVPVQYPPESNNVAAPLVDDRVNNQLNVEIVQQQHVDYHPPPPPPDQPNYSPIENMQPNVQQQENRQLGESERKYEDNEYKVEKIEKLNPPPISQVNRHEGENKEEIVQVLSNKKEKESQRMQPQKDQVIQNIQESKVKQSEVEAAQKIIKEKKEVVVPPIIVKKPQVDRDI